MVLAGAGRFGFTTLRGGAWNNPAENLRAAYRNRNWARNRNDNIGFRVAALPANTLTGNHRAGPGRAPKRRRESLSPPVLVGPSEVRASGRAISRDGFSA